VHRVEVIHFRQSVYDIFVHRVEVIHLRQSLYNIFVHRVVVIYVSHSVYDIVVHRGRSDLCQPKAVHNVGFFFSRFSYL
jgi:hypothetical protein